MLRLRFLFGEMNPPALAQSSAACGVARYLISALPAWLLVNSTAASPPTMSGFEPPIAGKSKVAALGTALLVTSGIVFATKLPSNTMAAFGEAPKTSPTDPGYVLARAPWVPPASHAGLPKISARVARACFTLGSVQGI